MTETGRASTLYLCQFKKTPMTEQKVAYFPPGKFRGHLLTLNGKVFSIFCGTVVKLGASRFAFERLRTLDPEGTL